MRRSGASRCVPSQFSLHVRIGHPQPLLRGAVLFVPRAQSEILALASPLKFSEHLETSFMPRSLILHMLSAEGSLRSPIKVILPLGEDSSEVIYGLPVHGGIRHIAAVGLHVADDVVGIGHGLHLILEEFVATVLGMSVVPGYGCTLFVGRVFPPPYRNAGGIHVEHVGVESEPLRGKRCALGEQYVEIGIEKGIQSPANRCRGDCPLLLPERTGVLSARSCRWNAPRRGDTSW